jgi:hypothetical protein
MMKFEVDGVVVHRPGVLDVLLYDSTRKPTLSHIRPQLLPGEELVERTRQIPAIVGAQPQHVSEMIRHQVVCCFLGTHPAMLAEEADPMALNCVVHSLTDAAEAQRLPCPDTAAWPGSRWPTWCVAYRLAEVEKSPTVTTGWTRPKATREFLLNRYASSSNQVAFDPLVHVPQKWGVSSELPGVERARG